jgi:hypothetical protein
MGDVIRMRHKSTTVLLFLTSARSILAWAVALRGGLQRKPDESTAIQLVVA